jgi:hypothetical protein
MTCQEPHMSMTAVTLPGATLHRLYRLAARWGTTKDRALEFLIDQASQHLSTAEWELAEQLAAQEPREM